MGLFDKFKKKEDSGWDNAYKANPQFYAKDDGKPFGAFALTEGAETILPKTPNYAVEGNTITEYRLMLVSTTKDAVIGDIDYSVALSKLENYKLDENDDSILLRGLSLEELESLTKSESKGVNKIEDKELKEWIANKVITDKGTVYYAVQGTKMMRLDLSEEIFNTYVGGFMKIHS